MRQNPHIESALRGRESWDIVTVYFRLGALICAVSTWGAALIAGLTFELSRTLVAGILIVTLVGFVGVFAFFLASDRSDADLAARAADIATEHSTELIVNPFDDMAKAIMGLIDSDNPAARLECALDVEAALKIIVGIQDHPDLYPRAVDQLVTQRTLNALRHMLADVRSELRPVQM